MGDASEFVGKLRFLAKRAEGEIKSFERPSAKTSAELVNLANVAADTIEVQAREIADNIEAILTLRRELAALTATEPSS